YDAFLAYTKKAFESIGTIKLYVTSQNNEDDIIEVFLKYQNDFVAGLASVLRIQQNILEHLPILAASNVTITVNTDAEAVSLKKRIEHEFRDFCRQAGIGNYVLSFKVETEKSKLDDFRKRTVLEDQEFVRH